MASTVRSASTRLARTLESPRASFSSFSFSSSGSAFAFSRGFDAVAGGGVPFNTAGRWMAMNTTTTTGAGGKFARGYVGTTTTGVTGNAVRRARDFAAGARNRGGGVPGARAVSSESASASASSASSASASATGKTPIPFNMHPIMVREFNLFPGLVRLSTSSSSSSSSAAVGRSSLSNLFGHASFLLLGYSYLTSDLLTLRALAVGGLSAAMVFQFFRPAPLWLPIQWNALFVAINVFWVAKLYYDENFADAYATDEERGLYARHFSHMPLGEFRQLLKIGKWRDIAPGTELTTEGKVNEHVFALVDGEVEVVIGGKHVNSIQAPSFVGEMSLMRSMTGNAGRRSSLTTATAMTSSSSPNPAPRVASATVVAQKGVVRVFSWDDKALRRLMRENEVIKSGVHAAVGVGLAEKLLNTRVMSTKMFEKHPQEVRGAIAS